MKAASIMTLMLISLFSFAKPNLILKGDKCPDLTKVTFELKTKKTKVGNKFKDTYTIKIINGAKAGIKVSFVMTDKNGSGRTVKETGNIDANANYKTIAGTAETDLGLNYVEASIELVDKSQCKDSNKNTRKVGSLVFTNL